MSEWRRNVKRLIAGKGWNQDQLAKAARLRPNTLSEALNKRQPRIDTVEAIASGLDVPMWALFVDDREYGLVKNLLQQNNEAEIETRRREDVRIAVQAEFQPIVDAIVTKLTGQPTAAPANPLPAKPILAPKQKLSRKRSA